MTKSKFNRECPFQKNVDTMRVALHMSVPEFCKALETKRETHDSTLRLNSPGWRTLCKYAEVLGVTPTDLLRE